MAFSIVLVAFYTIISESALFIPFKAFASTRSAINKLIGLGRAFSASALLVANILYIIKL